MTTRYKPAGWLRAGTILSFAALLGVAGAWAQTQPGAAQRAVRPRVYGGQVMWINPLAMLPGDPSVRTSFNAVNSGVGGGLSGLIVESTTVGNTAAGGGNKVVEVGLQVPPDYLVTGVRICYELSNSRSFFTQTRLDQVQNPPQSAVVLLDDGTQLTNGGPVCADSKPTSVDPANGAVFLSLRLNFGNTSDRIVLRALGLHLAHK